MTRLLPLVFLALSQLPIGTAASACGGADLTVSSLRVASVHNGRYLISYRLEATATNAGRAAQVSNVLQFLDVKQYGKRLDDRGIPPLRPGQSYKVVYVWQRAVDAGKGTTPLNFRIRVVSPLPLGNDDCNPTNGAKGIWF